MKISSREKIMLISLAIILVIAGSYFLLIKPKFDQIDELKVEKGELEVRQIEDDNTIAGGIRVPSPIRGSKLLTLSKSHNIRFKKVEEDKIIPGRDCLAQLGFYVEPTSAVVWDALSQVMSDVPEPIILILTGSGMKHTKI